MTQRNLLAPRFVASLNLLVAEGRSWRANVIKDGTWTIGKDIEPGTYRNTKELATSCYWSITVTEPNGVLLACALSRHRVIDTRPRRSIALCVN